MQDDVKRTELYYFFAFISGMYTCEKVGLIRGFYCARSVCKNTIEAFWSVPKLHMNDGSSQHVWTWRRNVNFVPSTHLCETCGIWITSSSPRSSRLRFNETPTIALNTASDIMSGWEVFLHEIKFTSHLGEVARYSHPSSETCENSLLYQSKQARIL